VEEDCEDEKVNVKELKHKRHIEHQLKTNNKTKQKNNIPIKYRLKHS